MAGMVGTQQANWHAFTPSAELGQVIAVSTRLRQYREVKSMVTCVVPLLGIFCKQVCASTTRSVYYFKLFVQLTPIASVKPFVPMLPAEKPNPK